MKYKNMNTTDILEEIFEENDLSKTTRASYKRSVKYFEEYTKRPLSETLNMAEKETNWKQSQLKKDLMGFRNELNKKYKKGTGKEYYAKIIAILNFYEIQYGKIKLSKNQNMTPLRDSSELPTQDILKKCVELKNNLIVKPTALLLSSTGLSTIDLLNMTVEDYLIGTKDYHNYYQHYNILQAIYEMDTQQVIPMFKGSRQKTGTEYITFASPESVKYTNIYLLSREDELMPDSILFKISRRQFNKYYQDINDQLRLGKTSEGIAVFSPKNLRSYHATQLELAGMNDSRIDILEGRKPTSIIRKHYIKVNTDNLREEYIRCLPYLVIDDFEKIKTELDVVKEENEMLKQQNQRIDDLEKIVLGGISDEKLEKLHKLL